MSIPIIILSREGGTIEACLAEEKAGLQIIRFKSFNKDVQEKGAILKSFIEYIWDVRNMNHIVLAIHIYWVGSGLDENILMHLGFVSLGGIGTPTYTILNPSFMELVNTFAPDEETNEALTAYYNLYQKRKKSAVKYFRKWAK